MEKINYLNIIDKKYKQSWIYIFKKLEVSNGKYNSVEKSPRNCKVVSHRFPGIQDCICLHINCSMLKITLRSSLNFT